MKIEIELSEKNEGTSFPYWVIIAPKQMMKPDCHHVAYMVTGIFFSRKSANEYLKAMSHHFSDKAVVYCMSGYDTDWEDAIMKAKDGVKMK